MKTEKQNVIVELTFDFSLAIIEFTEELEGLKKFHLAKQLFRSGTSIGANVNEAQNAESRADFIHKMKISAKETDETIYWLKLCVVATNYPTPTELIEKVVVIQKILNKIIGTTKRLAWT